MEYDGHHIGNIYDYYHAMENSKPGTPVELVVIRSGLRLKVNAVPEQR